MSKILFQYQTFRRKISADKNLTHRYDENFSNFYSNIHLLNFSKYADRISLFCLFCCMLEKNDHETINMLVPMFCTHVYALLALYLYDKPEYFKKIKIFDLCAPINFADFGESEDSLVEYFIQNSGIRFLIKNMNKPTLQDLMRARYQAYDLPKINHLILYPRNFGTSILYIRQCTPVELKEHVKGWLMRNRNEWKTIVGVLISYSLKIFFLVCWLRRRRFLHIHLDRILIEKIFSFL